MKAPRSDVFILHWNRPIECIITVSKFLAQDVPLQITVLDNGSSGQSRSELIFGLPEGIGFLELNENLGWGAAFNLVLKRWLSSKETSEFCFISAHDALPETDCIRRLLEAFAREQRLGLVSPDYGLKEMPTFSPSRGARLVEARRPLDEICHTQFVHGTLMGFRKECLREIGYFDERYFAYGDETEISLRAVRHNWDVAVVTSAIARNPGSWTPGPLGVYLLTRGSLLMSLDYGGRAQSAVRTLVVLFGLVRVFLCDDSANKWIVIRARLQALKDFFLGRFGRPTQFL